MTIPALPLICIAVAYLLVYIPHFVAGSQRFKMPEGFDNNHPRDQTARLAGWAKRASAAHMNGHETFSPFAIAVVVAWVGHASEHTIGMLAIAFVVLRTLYIAAYIGDKAFIRSALWTCSLLVTFTLFLLPLFS